MLVCLLITFARIKLKFGLFYNLLCFLFFRGKTAFIYHGQAKIVVLGCGYGKCAKPMKTLSRYVFECHVVKVVFLLFFGSRCVFPAL
jgi:hypothetical protein